MDGNIKVRKYENGNVEEITYLHEKRSVSKVYNEGGVVIATFTYVNDVEHGPYKTYHINGQIQEESEYRHGVICGTVRIYYPNGKLLCESVYANHKKNGLSTCYYENGNVNIKCHYKNDAMDGLYRSFYQDGQVKVECLFVNNKICGAFVDHIRKYYIDGVECSAEQYREHELYIDNIVNLCSKYLLIPICSIIREYII